MRPTSYVAEGYDALDLIIKAINECKEINTDCIKLNYRELKIIQEYSEV